MVAEMANCGAACHLEDGDGDIPAPGNKDNLTESEGSGSENTGTSTEDSSEEEEEDKEGDEDSESFAGKDGGEEDDEEADAEERESVSRPGAEASNGKDERPKYCCEKCKAIQQSHSHELVTPRKISKGRLQVQLEGEGTYECSVTGLVFEASEQVLLRYSVLSWSKFGAFLRDSWKFAGPIFNVDTVGKDASVLRSIQFPHSVCLADPKNEMTFSVLHIKDNRSLIEPIVDHSGSHVKWNVSSLSPVGPIIQTTQSVEHHGVVLVYKQLGSGNNNYSFHVYLATNSASDIKDIRKQVQGYKNRYVRIEKPPTCKLDEGTYRLLSEPEGEIKPEDLKFTLAVTKMKGYFEAFFEQPPPFKLSLVEIDTNETVWSATIREGDCVGHTEKKPRKRTNSRLGSSSPSEGEETGCKRPRWRDETDGIKAGITHGQDMTEKQLLQVAKRLGTGWRQVAIDLEFNFNELDDIQAAEKDVTMQKLKMLVEWKKRRQPGEATAYHLSKSVENLDDLPNEVHQILQDMIDNRAAK
ncbi:NACHT, LRR and PYD domains-containing protein 1a allele 5 [Labrus mixtus]|uniref:NACHT, LRR and PYD domains-containing protein 1a allele 5 n=1 Tax=Labrus mixtus TaxID=508554 RepID=UPI0029C00E8D|nr:NACHT, LRR and PYD domains-containing protein 1a allele 5 [Labrus mixtus]